MAKPYSLGLCERVVVRVVAGDPVRLVARRFGVSASSVVKWSQRFRATGSAAAGKMGGMRPKLLVGQHRGWLLDRIVRADFTLRGLVAELAERGVKVDDRTVWSFVHAERLSFKKPSQPARRTARTSPVAAADGRRVKQRLILAVSSSSTKPGPRRIWHRCAAGALGVIPTALGTDRRAISYGN
jgi:transposase